MVRTNSLCPNPFIVLTIGLPLHPPGDESTGDGTGNKKQFLNKRAGHYNEYKVLQAMRAKLAAETEEEDEED